MSILWEKSEAWRWLVRRTKESKPFFFGFAIACGVVPLSIGYVVMQLTNTRSQQLELLLRQNSTPDSRVAAKVNREMLEEFLGEFKRKDGVDERYAAAMRGQILVRKRQQQQQQQPSSTEPEKPL